MTKYSMVFANRILHCLQGRIKILTPLCRYTQPVDRCFHHSTNLTTFPVHCRAHHFYTNGHSQLFRHSPQRFTGHRSPLSHRRFQTRRRMKEEDSLIQQHNKSPGQKLLKPFFFTVAFCGVSFTGAMVWQYETMRYHAKRLMSGDRRKNLDSMLEKSFGFRAHINSMWNNLSQGQKLVAGVVMANFGVYLLWRIPVLLPFMSRYFSCQPGGTLSSMVLCSFSHYNFLHLFCNMYVLWSFSSVALNLFGKEQLSGVFVSAAAISSFTSIVHKTLKGRVIPSLGASGALMAVLGAVCLSYPNAKLSIAFIGDIFPHSFSASNALTGIIIFDAAGLLLGWRLFDHAAHLGGMLFGLWYVKYGRDLIWKNREPVMKVWHSIRGKP